MRKIHLYGQYIPHHRVLYSIMILSILTCLLLSVFTQADMITRELFEILPPGQTLYGLLGETSGGHTVMTCNKM